MIYCKKTPVGYQIQINGPGNDVVKESLHIIQGVYETCADNSKQEAEKYKKLILSAVLGLDGYCIFDAPRNSVRVDLSLLHEMTGTEGIFDGGSEEIPR